MTRNRSELLPISNKPIPNENAWQYEVHFINSTHLSKKSILSYKAALRMFADWIQIKGKYGYKSSEKWPLSPKRIRHESVLAFSKWLGANRSNSTNNTYVSIVYRFLVYLETIGELSTEVRLGKLKEDLSNSRKYPQLGGILDPQSIQDALEQIVSFYEVELLPKNEGRYKQKIILLRNRGIVQTLFTTGIGISELVAVNRNDVNLTQSASILLNSTNGGSAQLTLSEDAKIALLAYLNERVDNNPALFVAHSRNAGESRLSITGVHNIVKKAVNKLDLHKGISARDFSRIKKINKDLENPIKNNLSPEASRIFSNIRVMLRLSKIRDEYKEIAIFDLKQAKKSFDIQAYKGCIVMLGAVLEGIMLGTLLRNDVVVSIRQSTDPPLAIKSLGQKHPDLPTRIEKKLGFEDYKNSIHHLIPHIEKLKVDGIQSFRNSIHPSLNISDPLIFSDYERFRSRALHHLTSLELLAHHILIWSP